mgnify:CR=1 FL=1
MAIFDYKLDYIKRKFPKDYQQLREEGYLSETGRSAYELDQLAQSSSQKIDAILKKAPDDVTVIQDFLKQFPKDEFALTEEQINQKLDALGALTNVEVTRQDQPALYRDVRNYLGKWFGGEAADRIANQTTNALLSKGQATGVGDLPQELGKGTGTEILNVFKP